MDIGIMNHICGADWITIQSFPETDLVNEGALAEQFVGQHLVRLKNESSGLCYWVREAKSSNAEVDYVFSQGPLIFPIEVKAGRSGSLKSLQQFVLRKNANLAVRFDSNPPSIQTVTHTANMKNGNRQVSFTLLSLPLYMVGELPRLVDHVRTSQILRNND